MKHTIHEICGHSSRDSSEDCRDLIKYLKEKGINASLNPNNRTIMKGKIKDKKRADKIKKLLTQYAQKHSQNL